MHTAAIMTVVSMSQGCVAGVGCRPDRRLGSVHRPRATTQSFYCAAAISLLAAKHDGSVDLIFYRGRYSRLRKSYGRWPCWGGVGEDNRRGACERFLLRPEAEQARAHAISWCR